MVGAVSNAQNGTHRGYKPSEHVIIVGRSSRRSLFRDQVWWWVSAGNKKL